jgi:hypothetical protein
MIWRARNRISDPPSPTARRVAMLYASDERAATTRAGSRSAGRTATGSQRPARRVESRARGAEVASLDVEARRNTVTSCQHRAWPVSRAQEARLFADADRLRRSDGAKERPVRHTFCDCSPSRPPDLLAVGMTLQKVWETSGAEEALPGDTHATAKLRVLRWRDDPSRRRRRRIPADRRSVVGVQRRASARRAGARDTARRRTSRP